MLNPFRRLIRCLKPTPLEERDSNDLPRWLLKLFGAADDPPPDRSIDAWEAFTRRTPEP